MFELWNAFVSSIYLFVMLSTSGDWFLPVQYPFTAAKEGWDIQPLSLEWENQSYMQREQIVYVIAVSIPVLPYEALSLYKL